MSVVLKRMVLLSALIGASAVGAVAEAQDAVLEELTLASRLVPSDVRVGVLLPPGYGDSSEAYPLLLFLHGGGGDSSFLGRLRPLIEQAWARNEIPKMVVATPSAGRSFYMDYYDGSQKWETFIMTELLDHLRKQYRVGVGAANTLVGGLSMGGMGALRLAFKYPSQFGAVAALAPAIEPAFSFDEIDPSDRSYRRDAVYWEKFGKPVDRQYWRDNHPPLLSRRTISPRFRLPDSRYTSRSEMWTASISFKGLSYCTACCLMVGSNTSTDSFEVRITSALPSQGAFRTR